jgi:two-component system, OmpR family, sensor histidine kinase VicK
LQPVDLVKLISDTCNDFRKSASDKGLDLVFGLTDSKEKQIAPDIFVYADQSLLREALSNLIENAIKYTSHGMVKIDATINGHDKAVISVSDTGIGIAPEDLPHLFQKFYRVDNTQTREIGGTGLGLYLTRSIIENMHGRIWAESRIGQGSFFFIELRRLDRSQRDQLQQTVTTLPNQ